jgi:hypothetical protein
MPIKKTKVSRTAPKKGGGFQFRWWMALILIGVVAVIGVLILRFSHASNNYYGQVAVQCLPNTNTCGLDRKKSTANTYGRLVNAYVGGNCGGGYGETNLYWLDGKGGAHCIEKAI